eukprot:SAG31_NODE_7352_length_1712_cov_1.132052_3_plen_99_part_01
MHRLSSAYMVGLVESIRARVENAGRCELSLDQKAQLWWSKAVHIAAIPVSLTAPLPLIGTGSQALYGAGMSIPFVGYCLAGRIDAVGPGSTTPSWAACA